MVHPDLQPASYLLLSHLAHEGPMRSSAIAESFGIDKGAISRQVQHLVDLGLVERMPDPADGRATLLSASDDAADPARGGRPAPPQVPRRAPRRLVRGRSSAAFVRRSARYNVALDE